MKKIIMSLFYVVFIFYAYGYEGFETYKNAEEITEVELKEKIAELKNNRKLKKEEFKNKIYKTEIADIVGYNSESEQFGAVPSFNDKIYVFNFAASPEDAYIYSISMKIKMLYRIKENCNIAPEAIVVQYGYEDNDSIKIIAYKNIKDIIELEKFNYKYGKIKGNDKIKDFYISRVEVNQAEFESLMGYNTSGTIEDKLPVNSISWYDAAMYCNKLSEKEGRTPYYLIEKREEEKNENSRINEATVKVKGGNGYRLPTKEEYELFRKELEKVGEEKGSLVENTEKNAERYYFNTENDLNKKNIKFGFYDLDKLSFEWCENNDEKIPEYKSVVRFYTEENKVYNSRRDLSEHYVTFRVCFSE